MPIRPEQPDKYSGLFLALGFPDSYLKCPECGHEANTKLVPYRWMDKKFHFDCGECSESVSVPGPIYKEALVKRR